MTHRLTHAYLGQISNLAWEDRPVRTSYLTVEGPTLLAANVEREGGTVAGDFTHSVVNKLWMHQETSDGRPVTMLRPWRTHDDPPDSPPDVWVIRFEVDAEHPDDQPLTYQTVHSDDEPPPASNADLWK